MVTAAIPASDADTFGRLADADFRVREPARLAGRFWATAGATLRSLCALAVAAFFLPCLLLPTFLDFAALESGLALIDLAIESLMPWTEAFADESNSPRGFSSAE